MRITGSRYRRVAAAVLCLALLSGCASGEPDGKSSAAGSTAATPSATAAAGQASGAAPLPKASVKGWKVYSDPDRIISFELPADWIVQRQAKPTMQSDGGIHLNVRDAAGKVVAELHTRLKVPKEKCGPGGAKEYAVVLTEPAKVASAGGKGSLKPLFVFRTLLGYQYFGSYGLTDQAGGEGGYACRLQNTVAGPKQVGVYSFANAAVHGAPAPGKDTGALEMFGLIAEAKAFTQTERFKTIKQVIKSLKIHPEGKA
jgi:hypothetical protein